jgi:hypothetical protein
MFANRPAAPDESPLGPPLVRVEAGPDLAGRLTAEFAAARLAPRATSMLRRRDGSRGVAFELEGLADEGARSLVDELAKLGSVRRVQRLPVAGSPSADPLAQRKIPA